jgi:hypothetical protein
MLGDFVSSFQFVVLLLLTIVSGAALLLYAAHVFVTIAEQTAGGLDEVGWPKDPWYDWIGQALHLGWLVAFWAVPLGFVVRLIGSERLAASAALYVGAGGVLFWLLFPVTLLSSFSAGSPWVLVRREVLARLARRPLAALGFYALTAPLCLVGGAALYATLAHGLFYVLPLLATVLFLYARLAGRHARVLGRVRLRGAKPKVDRVVRRAAEAAEVEDPWGTSEDAKKQERRRKKKKKPAPRAHDPWAVPEEEAAGAGRTDSAVEGYGLAEDETAPKGDEAQQPLPVEGYGVSPEEPPARPKEAPADGTLPVGPTRTPSEREQPLPARPLVDSVFSFPWYPSNLGTWGLLSLLFLGWGLIYSALLSVGTGLLNRG